MLDDLHSPDRVNEELTRLGCGVNLPQPAEEFLDAAGPTPQAWGDLRRFRRFHCRGQAVLEYQPTFPSLIRSEERFVVYTKDVSREGMSLLHVEQLFPRERAAIMMPDGVLRAVEAVWCRKLQKRCFEIGARFMDLGQGSTVTSNRPPTP